MKSAIETLKMKLIELNQRYEYRFAHKLNIDEMDIILRHIAEHEQAIKILER